MKFDGSVLYVWLGGFVWGVVGAGNLCYSWAEFFIELGFNSPTSYFVLGFEFCSCWSYFGRLGC
jgi:hypothetical protein